MRIALTGSHSGPEFDKLIPLLEEGAVVNLVVPSVCARIKVFVGAERMKDIFWIRGTPPRTSGSCTLPAWRPGASQPTARHQACGH